MLTCLQEGDCPHMRIGNCNRRSWDFHSHKGNVLQSQEPPHPARLLPQVHFSPYLTPVLTNPKYSAVFWGESPRHTFPQIATCCCPNFRCCSQPPAVKQHKPTHERWRWSLQLAFCLDPPKLATLPGAALHTVYTFEEQDWIFCPLIPRDVSGFVQHSVLEHNQLRVCKYPNSKTHFPAIANELCGTWHLHSLKCQEAISWYPSPSHQDNTHFTGKSVFAAHFTLQILQFSQELEAQAVCKLPAFYSTEFTPQFLKHRLKQTTIHWHLMSR